MDEIAERGLAAHWKYKGVKEESTLDSWLTTLRESLEDKESNLSQKLTDFKLDLYEEEILSSHPRVTLQASQRSYRAGLCICHPFEAGCYLHFRQGERQERTDQAPAEEWRPGGD